MNTPQYALTNSQKKKIARYFSEEIHSDEHFKTRGKKERRPWGFFDEPACEECGG